MNRTRALTSSGRIAASKIGRTAAAAIEHDAPAERRQTVEELGEGVRLPRELDVTPHAVEVEKVERTLAEDLIRDAGVTDGDASGLGILPS
jgi:hypothetical protein